MKRSSKDKWTLTICLLSGSLLTLLSAASLPAKLIPGFYPGWKKYPYRPAASHAYQSAAPAVAGKTWTEPVTGMEFVWVPGGCFQMGSPVGEEQRISDEGPQHKVCLDGFYMGRKEVTQGQWQKIMGNNPSHFKSGGNYPVEQVSWDDAQDFIRKQNSRTGKQFRLPTEAEWEYAARAGTSTPFAFGSTIATDQVNFGHYSYGKPPNELLREMTTPVGSFRANGFGLYDMHGNVWEWCQDWYAADYYYSSPRHNPQGPSSGSYRVLRGGSWNSDAGMCRSAGRRGSNSGDRGFIIGLRLVLGAGQMPAGNLEAVEMQGFFVNNRKEGRLFVIQGQVRNDTGEGQSGIAVKGRLYDGRDCELLQRRVFCGNTLTAEELRSMTYDDMIEHMNNPFGKSLTNLNVSSGKTIPFTIVFNNLPDGLASFTVEVSDSKPVSR